MSHPDQIFEQVKAWDQDAVRNARVLVVGAGALGNEVLKNLALLNVGKIAILDFDHVEHSNLSRSVLFREEDAKETRFKAHVAAERLVEINGDLSILTLVGDVASELSIGLLKQIDVVIGCLDNRLARLYLNRLCWRAGVPWVDGGILNLSGQIAAYLPQESCYECTLSEAAWKEIRLRQGCTDMATRYALQGQAPTTPIAASIAGALQVQEALRIVMGKKGAGLSGKMLNFEGAHNHFGVYDLSPLKPSCQSHYHYEPILAADGLSFNSTVGDTFAWLREQAGILEPVIHLDHSVTKSIAGLSTGKLIQATLPIHHFSDRLAREFGAPQNELCGIPPRSMHEKVTENGGFESLPLWRLGIPQGHVIRIGRGAERLFLSLSGDLPAMTFGKGIKHLPNPWLNIAAAHLLAKS